MNCRFLSMPLQHYCCSGGVVNLYIVVQIAILILFGVGEVFAADTISAQTAEFRVVSGKFNRIFARLRYLGDIVRNRGLVVPVKDKEQIAMREDKGLVVVVGVPLPRVAILQYAILLYKANHRAVKLAEL